MPNNDFTAIVPARLTSTRLPDKPLADIGGVPMLLRVLQQAAAAAGTVIAAVAETQLAQLAQSAGFQAVITGAHDSGSSRIAEAARHLRLAPDTVIINVQGDEPFIEPALIRAVGARAAATDCACATPCRPLADEQEYHNPAIVKVIGNKEGYAAYFSRASIPHQRGGGMPALARAHLGLYAYRNSELQRFVSLPPAPTEQAEQLEQLRILWHGGRIALLDCQSASFGIDTAEDLQRARRLVAGQA